MGSGGAWTRSPVRAERTRCRLLFAALLLGMLVTASSDPTVLNPKMTLKFTWAWSLDKKVDGAISKTFTTAWGQPFTLPYEITIEKKPGPQSGQVANVKFEVKCDALTSKGVRLLANPKILSGGLTDVPLNAPPPAGFAAFDLPWDYSELQPVVTPVGTIVAQCYDNTTALVGGKVDIPVVFAKADTTEVGDTATANDVPAWPDWAANVRPGTVPVKLPKVTALGIPPDNTPLAAGKTFKYSYEVSDTLLCLSGAPVKNTVTLVTSNGVTMTKDATAFLTVDACAGKPQINFSPNSPARTISYDWTVTKTVTAALSAPWGQPINIPYTVTIDRQPATIKRTLTFTVTGCPAGLEVKVTAVGGAELSTATAVGGVAQFVDIPWTSDTGAVKAECATGSVEEPVTFSDANTKLEHGTAVVTDTLNWPTWSSYPPGTDAPTNPTLAVTAGTYPAPGTVITGSTTYQYTWTVSNLVYCVTDAPVTNEVMVAPEGNADPATAVRNTGMSLITVTDCGAKPEISFTAGYPALVQTYDWTMTKTIGGTAAGGGASISVTWGEPAEIPYTLSIVRTPPVSVATLAFSVSGCPVGSTVKVSGTGLGTEQSAVVSGTTAEFKGLAWSGAPASGTITATCRGSSTTADVVFTPANTVEVRGTATLSDVVTWPTWSTWYPTGNWLTRNPVVAVSGSPPIQGAISDSVEYRYSYTLTDTVLCFTGAQVVNAATLVAGSGSDERTYKATATATLTVTGCGASPTFTLDTPKLQTSLTFAWTQAITPLTSTAVAIPWGTGADVQAQATFTRTVTSAVFLATFNLQISNPAKGPIAITNIQLSCPWGSNVMLPCGATTYGTYSGSATGGGTGSLMVVPALNTITCAVNNLPLQGSWGQDFTQPCTLLTTNWLGTQTQMTGLVLDFSSPTIWNLINNCAQWTVSCSQASGNAFYNPAVGGGPTAQEVCGSMTSNAPLPPQQFGISFSGGWVGDGSQPAACSSSVTSTCTSNLVMMSTGGTTTQATGGTQASSITLQATPIDCPKQNPLYSPSPDQNFKGYAATSPSPSGYTLKAISPTVTTAVTKTTIRGNFTWKLATQLTPPKQAVPQIGPGVTGRYTVNATRTPIGGAESAQYLLEGVVSVSIPAENTSSTSTWRVDEVYAVVAGAAVAVTCRQQLPFTLQAGGPKLDCPFLVSYNQGGNPNTLMGRAVGVSDWGARMTAEGGFSAFNFDNADISQAPGACAKVSQLFATNYFDLVQTTGIAPSFNPDEPTTLCSPVAIWGFDVRFTPKEGAPCGSQQVIQTVSAASSTDSGTTHPQAISEATFYITGTGCPQAPAEFVSSSTSSYNTTTTTTYTSNQTATGNTSTGDSEPPPPGLSVMLSEVLTERAAAPNWDLTMEPVAKNVTFKPGTAGAVGFKLTWSKTKPVTDYSGSVTVINNAAGSVEIDGVLVNLVDTMGDGDTLAEVFADCPLGDSGAVGPVSGSSTVTIPAYGRLSCRFTLRAGASGALVGTATVVDGVEALVSKQWPVTSLMADSTCGQLLSGIGGSELGKEGVLFAEGGVSEEEVCAGSSKRISLKIPADASTDRGCKFPVVGIAWIKQPGSSDSTGVVASAKADALVDGCSSVPPDMTASVTGLSLAKGRVLGWVVGFETDPAVADTTFDGESVDVNVTWRQRPQLEMRLNVSGEVAVKGSAAVTKSKIVAIPLCSAGNGTDCSPFVIEAKCKPQVDTKNASTCAFNLTRIQLQPGLLLPIVSEATPAEALAYDPARARLGSRSPPNCAVLALDYSIKASDVDTETETDDDAGAAAEVKALLSPQLSLPTEPFCELQKTVNFTLSFDGVECGNLYNFTALASATPTREALESESRPVKADLAFEVTC